MADHLKKQLAVRLTEEAHKRLGRLAKRHGGKAATIEEALKLLDGQNEMSREALIAEITRRLR